jgi:hypothetical protein
MSDNLNALYPSNKNALRNYSQYTPDEMLMLLNTGMLAYPEAPEKMSASTGNTPWQLNATGLKQDGYNTIRGNTSVDINGFTPSLNVAHTARDDYSNFFISPALAAELEGIRARFSQRYDKTGRQSQDYGLGTNLGDLSLNYEYGIPTEGQPTHMLDASMPLGRNVDINANVFTGADMPTTYGMGGSARVLGGELSGAGQYTPDAKNAAFYARFLKQF